MEHSYLAFDLGASSGRAVVGTLRGDRLAMEEVHRFETPLLEHDGRLFWDIEALWNEIRVGVRKALLDYPALRSVSIDSWSLDYVPLDAGHHILRNPFCYRDPRTRGRLEHAFERVPAAEIYARTGIQMMEINTLVQVLAELDEEPELTRRTDLRLFIADYLLFRLGGRPVSERTMASTSQLMNIRTDTWDFDLMTRLGIPTGQWPDVVDAGTVVGRVSPDPAGDSNVAIVAGCSHDTAAAVAAIPADDDRGPWAYISCGTWSLLGTELAEPLLTEAARTANFTNEAGLDGTIRFLKNLTGLWVLQECEREWLASGHDCTYEQLLEEAIAAPSTGALLNLEEPAFRQRGKMIETLRSSCRTHRIPVPSERGEIIRLILESLADGYRSTLETLDALVGERMEVVHLVGGGSQNALLCRLTAEACGRSVVAGPAEAAVVGNLLVQARTLGHLPSWSIIRDVVRGSFRMKTYHPSTSAYAH